MSKTAPLPVAAHDPYQALRHRDFRWFLFSSGFTFLAALIQSTVVGWQVYSLTKDPLSLGYVGLAEAIPFLALTLVGGWLADQIDRRLLTLLATLVVLVGSAWLLALNLGPVFAVWPFYAVQALSGLGRAFLRPASVALSSETIPRDAFPNAATWRTTLFTVTSVSGPALGGLLIGLGTTRLACAVMVGLQAAGLLCLLQLAPRPRRPDGKALFAGLAEGIRFVFSRQVILAALSLDLFAVLFGGAVALLPAFAQDVLKVGGVGFGFLRTAPSAGAILMSLALTHRPIRRGGPALLWSVAFFGVTWVLFAFSTNYFWSLALLAVGGALDGLSMVVRGTLIQVFTPEHMMGRVQAVNSFFIGSSNELGAAESGLAARWLGLVASVVFGGVMTLLTVGFTAWRAPQLRRLDRLSEQPESSVTKP